MQRKFKRTIDTLTHVFEFADEFYGQEAIDPKHRYAVSFAIEELFTNMVKYNPGNTNDILIGMERADDQLKVSLTDSDVDGFDPTQAPDVDTNQPLEKRTPGGLGLHLIRRMMDKIEYQYADRQTKIVLTKELG